jgi:hypothetical protein
MLCGAAWHPKKNNQFKQKQRSSAHMSERLASLITDPPHLSPDVDHKAGEGARAEDHKARHHEGVEIRQV